MNHSKYSVTTALSWSLLLGSSSSLLGCSDDLGAEVGRAIMDGDSSESSGTDSLSQGVARDSAGGDEDVVRLEAPEAMGMEGSETTTGIEISDATTQLEVSDAADAGSVILSPGGLVDAGALSVEILPPNGSGCAGQTASVAAVADDLSSFTVRFGGYTAALGADFSIARLNCLFRIRVATPPGTTYAVTGVPLGGEASIQAGARGRTMTTYFYQGVSQTSVFSEDIPVGVGEWSTQGQFPEDQVQVAPCDVEDPLLVLNTSAVLTGPADAAPSSLSVDPEFTVKLAVVACE